MAGCKDNFEGFEVISGTSYCFSSEDEVAGIAAEKEGRIKTPISYFVQYQLEGGEQRLAYFVSVMPITRAVTKRVLDQYVREMGGQSYRAVELELRGAHCEVKAADGSHRSIGNEVASFARADYYLIERKKASKSV